VYPIARDDVWREYINRWIDYRTKDGTYERVYQQWILGKEYRKDTKAWSVYHDVLSLE
jgi:ABC-type amino acid transport substrate-binding protein